MELVNVHQEILRSLMESVRVKQKRLLRFLKFVLYYNHRHTAERFEDNCVQALRLAPQ
jgi:hypothetical protein